MLQFMQTGLAESLGPEIVILWIFLLIVAVLWIILPFAVFGIKNRLDKLNRNVAKIGTILRQMNSDGIEADGIDQSDIDEFLGR